MSKVRGSIPLPLLLLALAAIGVVAWLLVGGGLGGSEVDGRGGAEGEDRAGLLLGTRPDGAGKDTEAARATLSGTYDSEDLGGIRVRLLWLATGKPVVAQPVRLIGVRGVLVAELDTDGEGRAFFRDVAPNARYTLHIQGEGFAELLVRNVEVLRGRITDVPDFRLGEKIVLSGRVVDASGRPVPGSAVSVHEMRSDLFQRGMIFAMVDMATGEDVPLARAKTDADGFFNFGTLDSGRYRLQARSGGYATDYEDDVLVRSDRDATVLTLVLGRGADIRGTVKDDQGKPVANALVRAMRDEGRRFNAAGFVQREEAVTDAEGRYTIDTLTPGTDYRFGVIAAGYPTMWQIDSVTAEAGLQRDFTLPRGARIQGVVREKGTGKPVEGAEIVVMAGQMMGGRGGRGGGRGDGGEGAPATMGTQGAKSDAQGRYELDPVQSGPVMTLSVKARGYTAAAASMFTGNALPDLVAGETLEHDIELERGGRIIGRITEAEGGEPIVGAAVEVTGNMAMMWTGSPAATTDLEGRYELVGLLPGEYRVEVRADGFAEATSTDTVTISEQGNEGEINMALSGAGRLVGIVLDAKGDPVAGAKVFARGQSPDEENPGGNMRGGGRMMQRIREQLNPRVTVTDDQGRFELPGLAPRLAWLAAVTADGFVETESERVRIAEGDTREVEIVLLPGGVLEGRVVDEGGRWVSGARVRHGLLDPEMARRRNITSWEIQGVMEPDVVNTASDGTFRLTDLKAGLQVIQVEADGYVTLIKRDVRLQAGEVRTGHLMTVRRGETIKGIVLDDSGRPVSGAAVGMSTGGRPSMGGQNSQDLAPVGESGGDDIAPALFNSTQADGRFRIENVPPGTYSIYVWFAPGFRGATAGSEAAIRDNQVVPGANDIEFRLERAPAGENPFAGRGGNR
jgi:protocatechuate 3,4-dioxygenase beta subunit